MHYRSAIQFPRTTARFGCDSHGVRNIGEAHLLEILDDRDGMRSTIITSQLPIDRWHEYLGDPTVADAILDRVVHRAHRLTLGGHSRRKPNGNGPSASNGKTDA